MAYSQAIDIPGAPVSEDPDEWLFRPIESCVAEHHRLIMQEVQDCMERDYGRLIIMAPPGSAKSTYVGVVATSWALGRTPGYNIIYTSHSNPPAERMSRRTRQICRSPAYSAIWEHSAQLEHGSTAVREWKLTNGSTILNSGLEAGITSSRADGLICDDVIRGAEHANSPGQRDNTWQAYEMDALTRLKPSAWVIFIMTHWHQDDPIGRILPENYRGESGDILGRDGQVWRVVNLAAECEHKTDPLKRKIGEMLWPEWFTERHWNLYRKNTRLWSALFQQRPAPDSGDTFEREWFKRYSKLPRGVPVSYLMSTDFAQTDPEEVAAGKVDWTRTGLWAIDPDVNLYYEFGEGFQKAPDVSIEKALDLVPKYRPSDWLIESGGIYNAWNGYITRRMRERSKAEHERFYVNLVKMPTNQNKILKATAFQAAARAGRVFVKEGPEGDAFIDECCQFPFGVRDDRVDMAGQVGRHVDEVFTEPPPPPPIRKQPVKHLSAKAAEMADIEDEEAARRKRRFMG